MKCFEENFLSLSFFCLCTAIDCNSRNCSQAAMNISYGEAHELFGVGLSRSQQCGQHPAALLSDLPAVSTRHFSNQAMGVEQGEPTRHFGAVGEPLFGVLSWSEKEHTDVS